MGQLGDLQVFIEEERQDDEQFRNEYAEWEAEQAEAEKLSRLNALLRAARDGTIYDVREDHADK